MISKSLLLAGLLLFLISKVNSQNLIPNPGFEENIDCPGAFVFLNNTLHWKNLTNHLGTADLFWKDCPYNGIGNNAMAKNQLPKEGVGFIGMFCHGDNLREYCTVQLTSPLEAGKVYKIEFWVRPANGYGTSINSFGLHFSKTEVLGNGTLGVMNLTEHIGNDQNRILSDTNDWVSINGEYFAEGGELFVTIGNFRSDFDTKSKVINSNCIRSDRSYILLDGVSVVESESSKKIVIKELLNDSLVTIEKLDRTVLVKEVFYSKDEKLTAQIWDHNTEDGDSVNLKLNGEYILQNLSVRKKVKKIEFTLKAGNNILELEALNLGKYPPNTVAIILSEGKHSKRIVLNSNLKISEAIKIVWETEN